MFAIAIAFFTNRLHTFCIVVEFLHSSSIEKKCWTVLLSRRSLVCVCVCDDSNDKQRYFISRLKFLFEKKEQKKTKFPFFSFFAHQWFDDANTSLAAFTLRFRRKWDLIVIGIVYLLDILCQNVIIVSLFCFEEERSKKKAKCFNASYSPRMDSFIILLKWKMFFQVSKKMFKSYLRRKWINNFSVIFVLKVSFFYFYEIFLWKYGL